MKAKLIFEPRDLWIGIHWNIEGSYQRIYICFFPCFVIQLITERYFHYTVYCRKIGILIGLVAAFCGANPVKVLKFQYLEFEKEYQSALRLAKDFSNLWGIEVIFINERSQWHLNHAHNNQLNKILIGILCFMFLFLVAFCAVVLLRK